MANSIARVQRARRSGLGLAGVVSGFALLVGAGNPALAQQKAAPAAPAAAAPAGAPAQKQSAWVKLCEKVQLPKVGADGKPQMNGDKPVMEDKTSCLINHEQLTAVGMTLLSAAVQTVEGQDKQVLMVMIPPASGIFLPAGLQAMVLTKDQFAKLEKNEKIDEKSIVGQRLLFTVCHQTGCSAENELPPAMLDAMKKSDIVLVRVPHPSGQWLSAVIPLEGFAAAMSGAPIDNAAFSQQRQKLAEIFRANQIEQMKKIQEQLANPQSAAAAPAAGGAAPAAGAKAAAPPKK